MGALRYCGLMNANFYVGCILPWFSGPTHRVRSWTYALLHYEASTDGPPPLFPGTCDFKQQLLSLPRESAQRGKVPHSMRRFLSARLGWAFALLMVIINNGQYEDYKIITSILGLTSECWTGGHYVSITIWHQILETGSYPLGLNFNFRCCVAVTDKNLSE